MSNIRNIDYLEHSSELEKQQLYKFTCPKSLNIGDNIWPELSRSLVLIGRYSLLCRHKPLNLNILRNIFLDKLLHQMWPVCGQTGFTISCDFARFLSTSLWGRRGLKIAAKTAAQAYLEGIDYG